MDEVEIITKYQNGKEPEHYIMNGQDELVRVELNKKPNPYKTKSPVHIMTAHTGKTPFLKQLSTPTPTNPKNKGDNK